MVEKSNVHYELKLENDKLLEISEFVVFCAKNQHKDIALTVVNEAHCLKHTGVYEILDQFEFASVQLITSNALESHDRYQIEKNTWSSWLNQIDDFDYDFNYEWNESKIFGCFYGRPTAPRLGIAGHLLRYHSDISNVYTKFDFSSEDHRKLFDIERLFTWHPPSLYNLSLLSDIKTDHYYDRGHYEQSNTLSHDYKHIMIDIISEPVCNGKSFYPTEKFVRAVLCRRPFIVMASKNYLEYLRQMGFHTFNEFWDESYDGFDSRDRYIKILGLIDDLAKLDSSRLIDIFYASQYQRDHNFDLLVNKKFNIDLNYINE